MPRIEVNVDTYVDVEVDALDVVEECSDSEIRDILNYLEENDFILGIHRVNPKATHGEVEFNKAVNKLSRLYLQLDQEDWATIQKLIEKY
jgi:hypothetical protein